MKNEKTLEERFGWKTIIDRNKIIGACLGFEPTVEYCVGNENSICYSPASAIPNSHTSWQKNECEEWLNNTRSKYPDGWIAKGNYGVVKLEHYPSFHKDWNILMVAIKRLQAKEYEIEITSDIDYTWEVVYNNCIL